ncbi:17853_t:CDS:2, partial [Cetraspora pellucida]
DANYISVVNKQDDNVNENEKNSSMPTNEGSRPNQAPEIMPTMVSSSENTLVTTASVMPTPAAPIPVDPPQVLHRKRGPSV